MGITPKPQSVAPVAEENHSDLSDFMFFQESGVGVDGEHKKKGTIYTASSGFYPCAFFNWKRNVRFHNKTVCTHRWFFQRLLFLQWERKILGTSESVGGFR